MSTVAKINSFGSKPTKTAATIKRYMYNGRLLWDRACNEYSLPENSLKPKQLLGFLEGIFTHLCPRTIRFYLAASREYLDFRIKNNLILQDYKKEAKSTLQILISVSSSHYQCESNKLANLPERTSRKKLKKIPNNYIDTVWEECIRDNRCLKAPAVAMIAVRATLYTGLRPIEWKTAIIIGDELVVMNAKHTNGRGNGPIRHLNISQLTQDQRNILNRHLEICSEFSKFDDTWQRYMSRIAGCLRRLNRRYFFKNGKSTTGGKSVTLYSARHQFAANAKNQGDPPPVIAAKMGHISDRTAHTNYARKSAGSGTNNVSPRPSEVATVRQKYNPLFYAQFKRKSTTPGL